MTILEEKKKQTAKNHEKKSYNAKIRTLVKRA